MKKQCIAARLLAHFKTTSVDNLPNASLALGESLSSVQKCAYKMRDKGLLMETGETTRINKLQGKVWKITTRGKDANPVNPLRTKSESYGRTSQWMQQQQEIADRRRRTEDAETERRAGNVCKQDPDFSIAKRPEVPNLADRWQAEKTMVQCFSSMRPGEYAFPPASCAARAA